ncbi:DUF6707 family protein [Galactobacter valiniphilus]|uniref:Uncharacterized protein n=1 Tax=Galactobacter valiniphilus TaxID=2676122 RepID=A0A399JDG9_9MICC|nr:DUF6707 family protein [Galactobacter valiniphilus]RII42082.1 hypothetical protein DWB68_09165 [Galactobacter valiniphilus]
MSVRFDGEAPRHRRSVPARDIAPGDRFMRRSGLPSPPVKSARVVRDSFGTDAYVSVRLADGTEVIVAIASSIRVYTERTPGRGLEDLIAVQAEAGSAEEALIAASTARPDDEALMDVALKLGPGINPRAGAHLADLAWAADRLAVEHGDPAAATPLLAFLTSLDFDGNEGRWRPIRHALALAAWLARRQGHDDAAVALGARLAAGEEAAIAELRGPAQAIRRREITDPVMPDREIQRARDTGARADERELRLLRLDLLLTQLAHGRSGVGPAELGRAVAAEFVALGPGGEANTLGDDVR